MGSPPWKNALYRRLSPDREGERFTLERASGEVIEGMYVGGGSKRGDREYLIINTAPEGMGVRDPGYWDYEQWIEVTRTLKINGVPAPDFGKKCCS